MAKHKPATAMRNSMFEKRKGNTSKTKKKTKAKDEIPKKSCKETPEVKKGKTEEKENKVFLIEEKCELTRIIHEHE